jgi:pimeloyl-ACP methyl ester carboxylesterase
MQYAAKVTRYLLVYIVAVIRKPFLVTFFGLLVLLYGAAVAYLYKNQDKLLYHPSRESFEQCDLGEKVTLSENLRFYRIRGAEPVKRRIAFFHGNASRACGRKWFVDRMSAPDTEIDLIEYPGFAEVEKNPSQALMLKAADDWANYAKQDLSARIILFGESLGTGVATYTSTLLDNSLLVLFSPYNSIAEVGSFHYPFFPVRWILHDPFMASDWAAQSKSQRVLIFHGEKDNVVPFELGRKQVDNFKIPHEFVPYADRAHNDLTKSNEDLWNRVKEFTR